MAVIFVSHDLQLIKHKEILSKTQTKGRQNLLLAKISLQICETIRQQMGNKFKSNLVKKRDRKIK